MYVVRGASLLGGRLTRGSLCGRERWGLCQAVHCFLLVGLHGERVPESGCRRCAECEAWCYAQAQTSRFSAGVRQPGGCTHAERALQFGRPPGPDALCMSCNHVPLPQPLPVFQEGRTPLWNAAWQGHHEAMQLLLQHGADANALLLDSAVCVVSARSMVL